MVLNSHLLKSDLSLDEYKEVMPSVKYTANWHRLPSYVIARCPLCLTSNIEKIDTYSLFAWRWRMASSLVSSSVFHLNLIEHHCQHFALNQIFFNFDKIPNEALKTAISRERDLYVVGHLLESGAALAVLHALPVCSILENEFVPSYTLYIVSYFSHQPRKVFETIHRFNSKYYSWEASATLYLPSGLGQPNWMDLTQWIASKQLFWVDANDSEFNIHTSTLDLFPYKHLVKKEL